MRLRLCALVCLGSGVDLQSGVSFYELESGNIIVVSNYLIKKLISQTLDVLVSFKFHLPIHNLAVMLLVANLVADVLPGLQTDADVGARLDEVEFVRVKWHSDYHSDMIVL